MCYHIYDGKHSQLCAQSLNIVRLQAGYGLSSAV